jgi:hypothetical protein
MLELFPCERVAAEIGAGSDRDRNLGRRTIGEDSSHLVSRVLISKATKCGDGRLWWGTYACTNATIAFSNHFNFLVSGPLVFKARVTVPQWQDPMYSLLFFISAVGFGPMTGSSFQKGSWAAPLYLFTFNDQRSTSCNALAYIQCQSRLKFWNTWQRFTLTTILVPGVMPCLSPMTPVPHVGQNYMQSSLDLYRFQLW